MQSAGKGGTHPKKNVYRREIGEALNKWFICIYFHFFIPIARTPLYRTTPKQNIKQRNRCLRVY
jgi:hypothetical protein